MIITVSAFCGAFAAMVALAEIQSSSKVIRYLAAFVVGLVLAVLFGLLVGWLAHVFPGHAG